VVGYPANVERSSGASVRSSPVCSVPASVPLTVGASVTTRRTTPAYSDSAARCPNP